jgi:hypothetical protein
MSPKPHTFVALYSGDTIGEAQIIAASSDPDLVALCAKRMLMTTDTTSPSNPVAGAVTAGRRRALDLIVRRDSTR